MHLVKAVRSKDVNEAHPIGVQNLRGQMYDSVADMTGNHGHQAIIAEAQHTVAVNVTKRAL